MTRTPPIIRSRLSRVALNVRGLAQSARFYEDALGFIRVGSPTQGSTEIASLLGSGFQSLSLTLGEDTLELTQLDRPGAPYPLDSQANDLWFQHFAMLTDDMDAAVRRLQAFQPQTISDGGPQVLPPSSGGATAYKFRDPDGHPLEFLSLPGIAGSRSHKGLLYAINHSAISVAAAPASIAFYQETLGLSRKAQQINTGPEQDRLDGLTNVIVDVVTLLPGQSGPHLELLGYQQPRGRQPHTPLQAQDIAATRLVFSFSPQRASPLQTTAHTDRLISEACSQLRDAGARKVLLCDPDNHFLLVEPTSVLRPS